MKKLYRLEKNKLIAGVCAGIADMLKVDPTIVRLAVIFLTVLTVWLPGIVTYLAAWLLLHDKTEIERREAN